MSVNATHLFRQGSTIKMLLGTAAHSIAHYGEKEAGKKVKTPGCIYKAMVPPRHPGLVRDFIVNMGGNPAAYKNTLPPCMFPQWGMSMLARTLDGLDYDMSRILNGGCTVETAEPIPADKPLLLRTWLDGFDDDGRRVILKQVLVTGTAEAPDALTARVTAILPLRKKSGGDGKKELLIVPPDAAEIDLWRIRRGSGLDFAKLTGDINPVHWSEAYARMMGFRGTIMHGFAIMARLAESLNRYLWSGRSNMWKVLDVRFARPLPYPSKPGVFVDYRGGAFVGDAPGGPAYLTGSYTTGQGA
jgi:hypothetical protein